MLAGAHGVLYVLHNSQVSACLCECECVCLCGTASLVVVVALVTRGQVVADFHFANVCQSRPKPKPSTPPS